MKARILTTFAKTLSLTGVIAAATLVSQSALADSYQLLGKPNHTTEVVQLDALQAVALVPLLRPYTDRDGQLSVIVSSNILVLTASDARRAKMIEFIRTNDGLGLSDKALEAKAMETFEKVSANTTAKKQARTSEHAELIEKTIQLDSRVMALELVPVLRPFVSRQGKVSVDHESNQIIIHEHPAGMEELIAFIKELEMLALEKQ